MNIAVTKNQGLGTVIDNVCEAEMDKDFSEALTNRIFSIRSPSDNEDL